MEFILSLLFGVAVAFLLPSRIKGRPALSVFFVWLRRHKQTRWLMWNIPFTGDDSWYFDIVEREIYGDK